MDDAALAERTLEHYQQHLDLAREQVVAVRSLVDVAERLLRNAEAALSQAATRNDVHADEVAGLHAKIKQSHDELNAKIVKLQAALKKLEGP